MNLLHKYYSVGNLNIKEMLGKGLMTFARNIRLQNSIIPFDFSINYGNDRENGSEYIDIHFGQLSPGKETIAPYGIGRKISLFPIRDK